MTEEQAEAILQALHRIAGALERAVPRPAPPQSSVVFLVDEAQRLGIFKQTLFKVARRLGVTMVKRRHRSGQVATVVTPADLDRIVRAIR